MFVDWNQKNTYSWLHYYVYRIFVILQSKDLGFPSHYVNNACLIQEHAFYSCIAL